MVRGTGVSFLFSFFVGESICEIHCDALKNLFSIACIFFALADVNFVRNIVFRIN